MEPTRMGAQGSTDLAPLKSRHPSLTQAVAPSSRLLRDYISGFMLKFPVLTVLHLYPWNLCGLDG